MREQIFSKAVESGGRLTVKSALNPILWLCGIITIPTLVAGAVHPLLPIWVIAIGCSPVVVALFGFLFLLFFDRDKLQSEEFQIRKRTIEMAQQKGDLMPWEINPNAIISNPDLPSISGSVTGELP